MSDLRDAQGPDTDPATATRTTTLVIATIRGLLIDLLTTGDRVRIQDAAESFLITPRVQRAPTGRDGIGLRRGVVRPGRGIHAAVSANPAHATDAQAPEREV